MRQLVRARFQCAILWVSCLAVVFCGLLVHSPAGAANAPEYTKLKLQPGLAYEIQGSMNDAGLFVAADIEVLPKPRSPKLRGEIDHIDVAGNTITIFRRVIKVNSSTLFEASTGTPRTFERLQVGDRVEVSCKLDRNAWTAKAIKTGAIKLSDKIKGTVTETYVDAVAPDTLSIGGLLVLLTDDTDANGKEEEISRTERDLFGDLAFSSPGRRTDGVVLLDNRVFATAEYRHNVRSETQFDLSRQFESDRDDTQPELRVEASGYWAENLRSFAQLRLRRKYVISSDLDVTTDGFEADVTQLYVLVPDIANLGVALQLGRQDFDDSREWLFDDYLDAARLYYFGFEPLVVETAVIHLIEPLKQKFDTWTDFLFMTSWRFDKRNIASAYVLTRSDTATRNREPVWLGLRYGGDLSRMAKPWVELALMRGHDKGEDVSAWAIDIGATLQTRNVALAPSVTVGLAIASGDDTGADLVDHEFRQTSYQDNTAKFGGVSSLRYYGAVLDPELSNLRVWTIGAGVRPIPKSSIDVVFHNYRQEHPNDKVRGTDLVDPPARPNGVDTDIGWGLDVVVGLPTLWNHLRLSWTLGFFRPGAAYDPRQEDAWLNKINATVGF